LGSKGFFMGSILATFACDSIGKAESFEPL
jgi:hypothetical protein